MSQYQPLVWGYRGFLLATAPEGFTWTPIRQVAFGEYVAHGLVVVAKRFEAGFISGGPAIEPDEDAARDRAYYCLRHANAEKWGAREIA